MTSVNDLLKAQAIINPTREQREAIGMIDWWNDDRITQVTATAIKRVAQAWLNAGGLEDAIGWYTQENHAGGSYDLVGLDGVFSLRILTHGINRYEAALQTDKRYTSFKTLKQSMSYVATHTDITEETLKTLA